MPTEKKKVVDVLREETWTKKFWALDKDRRNCGFQDGVYFDLEGAIFHCYEGPDRIRVHNLVCQHLGIDSIGGLIRWNNDPLRRWKDIEEVIASLDI